METWPEPKQCCRVSLRICLASPSRHFSNLLWQMLSCHRGTWILQQSHLEKGEGCSSKILMIYNQCCQLKRFWWPLQVQEDYRQLVKGQGNYAVNFGKLTSYNWARCYVWLTGSRLQYISRSIQSFIIQCAVMEPAVSSMTHSRHGIRLRSCEWYDARKLCISNPPLTPTRPTVVLQVGT